MPATFGLKSAQPVVNAEHPLARGLVFAAELWERNGSVTRDLGPSRRTGTLTGSPTWIVGQPGPAIRFGTNKYISYGNILEASTLGLSISVAALVCWDGTGTGNRRIVRRSGASSGAAQYAMGLQTDHKAVFEYSPADQVYASSFSTSALTSGQWYLLVGVRDRTVARLYVDGVAQTPSSASATTWQAGTQNEFFISRFSATYEQNWPGDIAFVRIWNRALSAGEAAALVREPWAMMARPRAWPARVARIVVGEAGLSTLGRLVGAGGAVRAGGGSAAGAGGLATAGRTAHAGVAGGVQPVTMGAAGGVVRRGAAGGSGAGRCQAAGRVTHAGTAAMRVAGVLRAFGGPAGESSPGRLRLTHQPATGLTVGARPAVSLRVEHEGAVDLRLSIERLEGEHGEL